MTSPTITRASTAPREHAKLVRGAGDRLVIIVEPLPEVFAERGIYGSTGTTMPERYRFLHPEARASLERLEADYPGVFRFSDVFRNASGSKGRREKNRAKRIKLGQSPIYTGKLPGASGHGFGLCLDHELDGNLRRLSRAMNDVVDKTEYDLLLREYGWWCHRDGPNGDHAHPASESWHFNYFGDDPDRWLSHSGRSTERGLETKLNALYGPFTLDAAGVDEHLQQLGYDTVRAFQTYWTLDADGAAGPVTQRVLLYVGAEFRDAAGHALAVPFP